MNKKQPNKDEAMETLHKDFGEEGCRILMEGVDAIVDITKDFGIPYKEVQSKIKDSYEKGLVQEKDGIITGFEKINKDQEEEQE